LASYGPEGSLTSTKPFFRDKRSDIKYVEAKKNPKKKKSILLPSNAGDGH
jgi:hypothetical protein